MSKHKYFNTGDTELDSYLNMAINTFEENLKSTFDATVKDKDKFRKLFLSSLDTFLQSAKDLDDESGCLIDEVYGDDVFDSMEVTVEDDEDED